MRADEALSNLEIRRQRIRKYRRKDALSIVIDKPMAIFLKLKEAQLTGVLIPLEKQFGTIRVKEGSYEMNFNLIKRKFDIKKVVIFYGLGNQRANNISSL
jgi:hypothetical protein